MSSRRVRLHGRTDPEVRTPTFSVLMTSFILIYMEKEPQFIVLTPHALGNYVISIIQVNWLHSNTFNTSYTWYVGLVGESVTESVSPRDCPFLSCFLLTLNFCQVGNLFPTLPIHLWCLMPLRLRLHGFVSDFDPHETWLNVWIMK